MPDLILHRLPFGGVAFEPVTDAGARCLLTNGIGNAFYPGWDACMMQFAPDSDARGYEPQDVPAVIADIVEAGLTMEPAA